MEQTNLMQRPNVETKLLTSPTQKPNETAQPTTTTEPPKPKKKKKTLDERIRDKKNELKKLEKMAEEGKRAALIRILYANGIKTESALQEVLKKAGCVATVGK